MIRNETFNTDGVCTEADVIDLDAGTIAREENGAIVSTRALTPEEIMLYTPTADVRADLLARLQASPLMLDELREVVTEAIERGVI